MNADEIKELRDDIRAFVRECEEKQHTDTCAAHDLLNDCEDMLGQLVKEMTDNAEDKDDLPKDELNNIRKWDGYGYYKQSGGS